MSEELPVDAQNKIVVFGAKRIRRAWHEEQWFFSVVDIVGALTDSPNPRNYWNMMKAREQKHSEVQLSTLCVQLKLTSFCWWKDLQDRLCQYGECLPHHSVDPQRQGGTLQTVAGPGWLPAGPGDRES
ncbi:MAG TPA: hypothetical protein PKH24_00060 [Sedimentisphaerales bacterium]|jgi:hypothetical protein|nr:hypothetical protein [Sedimentisphaerales bacterium]HNU30950.1 hypothetical protein [Sedimentisphaerales bacterium]